MICKEDNILIAKNLIEIFKNRNNVHRIVQLYLYWVVHIDPVYFNWLG